jgi:hypothetical protein
VQEEDRAGRNLWRGKRPTSPALRVWLQVDRVAKAKEVIQAKRLTDDLALKDMRILRLRAETNYLLTDPQAARLTTLWANTGRDWNRAESLAGLWAYHQTYGSEVSRKLGSPVAIVADRIGRALSGVYNKVMNFRSIDPRDEREGLAGGGATDRAVWAEFYDEATRTIRADALVNEFDRLWPAGSQGEPDGLADDEVVKVSTGRAIRTRAPASRRSRIR